MYTHIYIYQPIRPSECLHTKNTSARRPVPHLGTKIGSPTYLQSQRYISYIRVPPSHPHLLLPQEEVVAHHHLLQAVVVEHPQDPPALGAGVHSSSRRAQLLVALYPAMVVVLLYTAPGTPHPRCISTCPQACPTTPSLDDGVYHQNQLRPPSEERVMAPHQGRRTGASLLPSRALLVTPRPHPADTSLHAEVSPALAELVLSTTPPRAHEVPHLHMQQTTTTDRISIYITYIWTDLSKT
jgi:hypothetical protein